LPAVIDRKKSATDIAPDCTIEALRQKNGP